MIVKLRKKPIEIDGIQWNGYNRAEIELFVGKRLECSVPPKESDRVLNAPNEWFIIVIPTLEGNMTATRFDWILKGVIGEFCPCKPDIIAKTYDILSQK